MSHFIELTAKSSGRRVLVRVESIAFIFDDEGYCRVGGDEGWIEVKESYLEIQRMLMTACL